MKKYILIGLVALTSGGLLVACGGSSSNNQEMINGIAVPPDPGEAGKETLAGIDSNSDGIRDDMERMIAEKYGTSESIYIKKEKQARTMQKLFSLTDSSLSRDASIEEYMIMIRCSDPEYREGMSEMEQLLTNTNERQEKYAELLGGKTFTPRDGSCEY